MSLNFLSSGAQLEGSPSLRLWRGIQPIRLAKSGAGFKHCYCLAGPGLRKRPVESREAEGKAREGFALLGTGNWAHEVWADFVKNAHTLAAAISAWTH